MGAANGISAGHDGSPGTGQVPGSAPRETSAVRARAGGPARRTAGQWPADLTMVRVPEHMKIVLDGPVESPHACRVDDPGRLLRVWALVNAASRELHQAGIPQAAVATLQRQLRADASELQRSLSPELAAELGRLMRHDDAVPVGADELRVEYATLLGWLGGVVIAMLDQLEQCGASAAAAAESQESGSSR
jgi:proteasome activator-like protein